MLMILGLALQACSEPAPPMPPVANVCSPRSWHFETPEDVRLDPSTSLLEQSPQTGLAPPFVGERQNALVLPVKFGPENYFVGANVTVCRPDERSTFLGQRLSVRLFVEGPPLPEGALITFWLWPELRGAAIPLEIRQPGQWFTYAGITPSPMPDRPLDQPSDVVLDFTYTGEAEWEGKIWIDELTIAPR